MTSRERVRCAFAHEEPDRVPAWCGASTGFWESAKARLGLDDEGLRRRLGDDFRRVLPRWVGPSPPLPPGATSITPFGVLRGGLEYGMALNHPLAGASRREVGEYPWPDPRWQDVSRVREEASAHGGEYAILGGDWSPFWHDLLELLGMEDALVAMLERPPLVDAVLERVVDYYLAVSERIFEEAAGELDVFFIGNDFGSQHGPLLGEAMFRRFVSPHLGRLVDLGHRYGLPVMLHSCGGFAELIPAMVEVGLDGLHALQPSAAGMDPRRLKAEFGDRILLSGAIDSQRVLIDGTPELVREKTRQTLEILMPGGGYVAGASHDWILPETPLENVLAMFDAIGEFGRYGG